MRRTKSSISIYDNIAVRKSFSKIYIWLCTLIANSFFVLFDTDEIPLHVDDSRVYLGQSVSNLSLMVVRPASCTGSLRERLSQKLVFLLARGRGRGLYAC